MDESELALIKGWQQADERATHGLFDQYYPRLVRFAVLNGLSQDCAQEAFLRAFERRRQLRDLVAFPLWLQRLFMHHLLDVLKVRKRKSEVPLEALNYEGIPQANAQPEDTVLATEWQIQLWQRVQALPDSSRIVLILRYYEDYSLREIAHLLGKREGTIRVIIFRALQRLRLNIEENFSMYSEQKNSEEISTSGAKSSE